VRERPDADEVESGMILLPIQTVTRAFAAAALAMLCIACNEAPSSPTTLPGFTQTDLRVGTGADAVNGTAVTVDYTGWLYDPSQPEQKGAVFDTSRGRTPFSFTLGNGQVIEGWERGVPGMKVGGLRRLVIPPALAYGSVRTGPLPPNATLVFEIELLSVP
jgi:FKBP-type peptidyl-prolyl cis-trans isomerase FkpA